MAIRKTDPTAQFKIICQQDDAVINETTEELEALKTGKFDEYGREIKLETRYERYLETLDESILKIDPDKKVNRFVVRCLKNSELAEMNERYTKVNVLNKTIDMVKTNQMFLETFQLGCLGLENENGKLEKVSVDDVGFAIAISMGSVISLFTSLGRHLKKL